MLGAEAFDQIATSQRGLFNMTLLEFRGTTPKVNPKAYVSPRATLIGNVEIGEGSSVWEHAVLRGDMGRIRVGKQSSIQDNCTLHSDIDGKCVVADYVTVGHNAVIHGSTVHDYVIVGMNSTILEGAEVGPNSIVAAGSVILEGEKTPPTSLLAGVPAKPIRKLDPSDLAVIRYAAQAYTELVKLYLEKR
jgi:carbonic anhydrase/acetyltransferase-like protein (isoleucine patch superfamily)